MCHKPSPRWWRLSTAMPLLTCAKRIYLNYGGGTIPCNPMNVILDGREEPHTCRLWNNDWVELCTHLPHFRRWHFRQTYSHGMLFPLCIDCYCRVCLNLQKQYSNMWKNIVTPPSLSCPSHLWVHYCPRWSQARRHNVCSRQDKLDSTLVGSELWHDFRVLMKDA